MLTIGTRAFQLSEALFEAHLGLDEHGWQVDWNIEVRAPDTDIEEMTWSPHLSTHWQLRLPPPEALAGYTLGPLEDHAEEPVFMLYIFDHAPVIAPVLHFGERKGTSFHLRLEGAVPGWAVEPQSESSVPIVLDCWLPFAGVLVDEFHEDKARERLAAALGGSSWEHIGQRRYRQHYGWRPADVQQAIQGDGPASGGSAP